MQGLKKHLYAGSKCLVQPWYTAAGRVPEILPQHDIGTYLVYLYYDHNPKNTGITPV